VNRIADRTREIAYEYLGAFGFERGKIVSTISKGLQELEVAFERLRNLCDEEFDAEAVDRTLHTIKGLLFQFGNGEDGARVERLRGEITAADCKEKILAWMDG
jgi:hypothetical protein